MSCPAPPCRLHASLSARRTAMPPSTRAPFSRRSGRSDKESAERRGHFVRVNATAYVAAHASAYSSAKASDDHARLSARESLSTTYVRGRRRRLLSCACAE